MGADISFALCVPLFILAMVLLNHCHSTGMPPGFMFACMWIMTGCLGMAVGRLCAKKQDWCSGGTWGTLFWSIINGLCYCFFVIYTFSWWAVVEPRHYCTLMSLFALGPALAYPMLLRSVIHGLPYKWNMHYRACSVYIVGFLLVACSAEALRDPLGFDLASDPSLMLLIYGAPFLAGTGMVVALMTVLDTLCFRSAMSPSHCVKAWFLTHITVGVACLYWSVEQGEDIKAAVSVDFTSAQFKERWISLASAVVVAVLAAFLFFYHRTLRYSIIHSLTVLPASLCMIAAFAVHEVTPNNNQIAGAVVTFASCVFWFKA